jgi:hypothetical protein
MMGDGFSTILTFANLPTVKIYEKEVTPGGVSGGGATDVTTMRNTGYRTNMPKKLKSVGATSAVVAYATSARPLIEAQINVNQLLTVTYPDGATWAQWGWIDEFTPSAHTDGEQPTATLTFQPSNLNNATPPVVTAPVYTASVLT